MTRQLAAIADGVPATAQVRARIGASYEGGDPGLIGSMLPHIDCIEVTLETMSEVRDGKLSLRPEIMAELRDLQTQATIVVHGVSLSIGSHDGWSPGYFRLLDEFFGQIDVAWHSEHLGYTRVGSEHLGIMLAMPKTHAVLDLLCERVSRIRQRYALPFLLENIVHVLPDYPGEMTDAAFLNALADRTGCGLILDTYNLECDEHNYGFDIDAFLRELRASHVRELHVARGVVHNGFLLDVHSQLPAHSTIEMAKQVVASSDGGPRVVVYEFMPEAVPGLGREAIGNELRRLRAAFAS